MPSLYFTTFFLLLVFKMDGGKMRASIHANKPFFIQKVEDLSFKNHNIYTHTNPLFSEVDNNNLSGQESFYNGPFWLALSKRITFLAKKSGSNTPKS